MLTARDEKRLAGVDARLVAVVRRAFELFAVSPRNKGYRLIVTEGVRTKDRQRQLYDQGRTKPGKVVTWTLSSKHIDGLAVDCAPAQLGFIPWTDIALFDLMGECFMRAATELSTDIRWGADWDRDGIRREKGESDSPHFEIAGGDA